MLYLICILRGYPISAVNTALEMKYACIHIFAKLWSIYDLDNIASTPRHRCSIGENALGPSGETTPTSKIKRNNKEGGDKVLSPFQEQCAAIQSKIILPHEGGPRNLSF